MPDEIEKRMIRIAKDTIKNPNKALLGGPSVAEAKKNYNHGKSKHSN